MAVPHKIESDFLNRWHPMYSTLSDTWIITLCSWCRKQAELMALHVEEKVLANIFIAWCKWHWVKLLKEAIKLLCYWRKIMIIAFFSTWICQPDGTIYNQILVVTAKSHKIFPIISELAKWIIRAIYVIYSVAWNQILIKLPNSVNLVWKDKKRGQTNLEKRDKISYRLVSE